MNNRRRLLIALCGAASIPFLWAEPVTGQPTKRIARIAYLSQGASSGINHPFLNAFRQSLTELGYVDGKNITIEYRFAEGNTERFPSLAAEAVASKPDVIVTTGTLMIQALRSTNTSVPVVVAGAGDLVGRGLVASLQRPGGNITGYTYIAADVAAKRLELLKEILPRATKVAVLYQQHEADELRESQAAARLLSIQLLPKQVEERAQLGSIYASVSKENAEALVIFSNPFTGMHSAELAELALKYRVPTVCEGSQMVDRGCLVSYAASRLDGFRRAAGFVDKILKGRKPADLPVEQPTVFETVINLKTAKALGITIPPTVLARADQVIQ